MKKILLVFILFVLSLICSSKSIIAQNIISDNNARVEYYDGTMWKISETDSLILSATCFPSPGTYGYYRVYIILENKKKKPFNLGAEDFFAQSVAIDHSAFMSMKKKLLDVPVYSYEKYSKKVNSRKAMIAALVAFNEGVAAYNAGYYHSTSNTNINYFSGTSNDDASISTSTYGYDSRIAEKAKEESNYRLNDFVNKLSEAATAEGLGYVKKTTIYPSRIYAGWVAVEKIDNNLVFFVRVKGDYFKFNWVFEKQKKDKRSDEEKKKDFFNPSNDD